MPLSGRDDHSGISPPGPPSKITIIRGGCTVTEENHVQGPHDAKAILVQYGDYECPYTRL